MSLEVLTLGSLDKLTEYCRTNPTSTKIIHQFEEINSELELTYAPVDYGFTEESFRPLAMPASSNDTLENDKKNVPILFNALKEMSLLTTLQMKDFGLHLRSNTSPTIAMLGGLFPKKKINMGVT